MDNISASSEIDFAGNKEAHIQKGSYRIYEAHLEGDPWLSPSNKTVLEEHNSSSKDCSKTAKDRRAKAKTNRWAQLYRSLPALDFEFSNMADWNNVKGEEKENCRCRQLETLRMYQSAPDSATDQKQQVKKLVEKRLVNAAHQTEVSNWKTGKFESLIC
jgi:hypothetical protein